MKKTKWWKYRSHYKMATILFIWKIHVSTDYPNPNSQKLVINNKLLWVWIWIICTNMYFSYKQDGGHLVMWSVFPSLCFLHTAVFMLVIMLEVQNSVMVLLILAFRIISVVFTYPNNLQIIGVRITEDALYMCVWRACVHACVLVCVQT